jgi:malonyl-CoA/methylmalonyl-CoA synthetase
LADLLSLFDRSLVGRAGEVGLEIAPAGGAPTTLTFGQIDVCSSRVAHVLVARGLRAGHRLAVQLANRAEFVDLFLACLKLGVLFVPINVLYRGREVGHIVADAAPAAVVTTPDLAPFAPPGTTVWDVRGLAAEAEGAPSERPFSGVDDATHAVVVYTSGTTGRAKGAVLSHGNLAANAQTIVDAWRIRSADRYLAVLPLFHVHGLGNGLCSWLASGCLMRLEERFEHERAAAVFEEFRPSLFFGVPTIYFRLLEVSDEMARRVGARMRLFVSGSAPLPVRVFEAFRTRFGHAILERYGMTETLMIASNPYDGERRPGTVGQPLPGVQIRIVDARGNDVKDGEVGELLVRGPAVSSGYWRRPDATAEAFGGGWFRTRDLAACSPDGCITLRGRASDLIITGGFNVYPREIEEVLLEQPGVREAVVVGRADERRGEVPVAYVAGEADPTALEAACRSQLASFKVPRAFVSLEALPRNALGKVQTDRLPAWEPPAPAGLEE